MAVEFTRLSDVALVEESTETTNVLIEENDEIKRLPASMFDSGGEKIAKIYVSDSGDILSYNVTFQELVDAYNNNKPLITIIFEIDYDNGYVRYYIPEYIECRDGSPYQIMFNNVSVAIMFEEDGRVLWNDIG